MEIRGIDKRRPFKSWQGEGPYAGQRIVGLRFMTCNLKCHWRTAAGGMAWCDTKWTWDGSEGGDTWDIDALVQHIVKLSGKRVPIASWEEKKLFGSFKKAKIIMVTGGEPLLRQNDEEFKLLITKLRQRGFAIHYETNGTIVPNEWMRQNTDFFDVSPKYQLYPKAYTVDKMKAWYNCGVPMAWKFVVGMVPDVFDLKDWLEQMNIPKDIDMWLMPLTTDDKSMRESIDVIDGIKTDAFQILGYKNVRVSPRLQITGGFP
jgi:7-carboxy-7-deazaguanine synthase